MGELALYVFLAAYTIMAMVVLIIVNERYYMYYKTALLNVISLRNLSIISEKEIYINQPPRCVAEWPLRFRIIFFKGGNPNITDFIYIITELFKKENPKPMNKYSK